MNCEYCKKKIVVIGDRRKNGKSQIYDWNNRKYHKKCYKLIIKNICINDIIKKYINPNLTSDTI